MVTQLWVNSNNKKTGHMPTLFIGEDLEETYQSCLATGCPLLFVAKALEREREERDEAQGNQDQA